MQRADIIQHIAQKYGVEPEYLWPKKHPGYAVFRCPSNGKWFGMLMDIPGGKIGLGGVSGAERTDILVLKNDPDVVALLLCKEGYVPAYHMNKEHWFSILLGDVVPGEEIRALIADSADMVCTRK